LIAWSLLAIIAFVDFKTQYIPNQLSYCLLWMGLILPTLFGQGTYQESILGAIFAYGLLKILQAIYLYGFKKMALGDADPLLAGAVGAWIGPLFLPYFFLGSSLLMMGVVLLTKRNQSIWQTHYPFGVGLSIAGTIAIGYKVLRFVI
jgi:leader peptidase (prepilin peptidase)/N-methyltransferase